MAVDVLFEVWNATVTDLTVFLLKILCNTCSSMNSASGSFRKVPPMLLDTFLLNGGLFVVY